MSHTFVQVGDKLAVVGAVLTAGDVSITKLTTTTAHTNTSISAHNNSSNSSTSNSAGVDPLQLVTMRNAGQLPLGTGPTLQVCL